MMDILRGEAAAEPDENERATAVLRRQAATIALIAIVLLGAVLRLNGRDWDQSHYLNPDERFMTMVVTGIRWPESIGQYFDSANSPLNPYNNNFPTYVYGTFPLFLGKLAGDISGQNVYGNFHIPARTLSAIFDLMTVVLVYLVGRRLFGVRTGLLAALLMSLTVLDIQASHFFTADAYLATLVLGVFYLAIRADDGGRWWVYLGAGITAGLAVATKLSGLPAVAMLLLPAVEAVRRDGWRGLYRARRPGALAPVLGVALSIVALIWTFRIAQPYAFEGPSIFSFKLDPRWSNDIDYWRRVQSGEIDMPPSHQWAARTPLVFLLKNLVLWGMGLPLGIAALAGLVAGGVRIVTARRWPPTWQVVLVGWPAVHILYYGTAFIKTMRYVLPAYPFLVLLAAAALVHFWQRGEASARSVTWRAIPVVLVVVLTAAYAIAFSGIYSRDSTRIAASRWIYDNVPHGSVVLTEHWDDAIPLLFPDEPSGVYQGQELQLYAEDNTEKLLGGENQPGIINQLNQADYIFVTSNRLYLSIPRIPERFPMSTEYYRMLFSGELGFELVKTFTSRPTLFGIQLNDDNAEEAFTVYDHPKVLIFKKTPAYDGQKVQAQLMAALENAPPVINLRPIQTGKNFLMFDNAERLAQQAGGTWSAIFDRGDLANRHPIRAWYLALQLLALVAIPLCWRVLGGLPDRGYAVSKTVGLMIAGYVAWLLPSLKLLDFGRTAVLIGVGVTAILSIAAVWGGRGAFVRDLRSRWKEILFVELLFLAAFFIFVWFRSLNPDLWHPYRGGEKPMEFAYFNAIIRSTHFPPYDPWFAGGYINYYYFGYVLLAAVTRLTGVIPSVAFNLAVPTLFALLVINSWSFVRNALGMIGLELSMRRRWAIPAIALLGPLFVVGIGNLDLARRIGRGEYGYGAPQPDQGLGLGTISDVIRGTWRAFVHAHPLPADAFWAPSRVIPDTVNEFPYFTFLFADFHPHMAGLTATSAVLVVALGVLRTRRWPVDENVAPVEPERGLFPTRAGISGVLRSIPRGPAIDRLMLVGLAAFMTGMLFPLNTWDYPTYAIIVVGAFALIELLSVACDASESETGRWHFTWSSLRRVAIWSAATVVLGRVFFLPYFAHYQQPNSGFDPWTGTATEPGQYLIIHGIALFFVASFLLAELAWLSSHWSLPIARLREAHWDSPAYSPGTRTLSLTVERSAISASSAFTVALISAVIGLVALLQGELLGLLIALAVPLAAVAWARRREPVHLFLCGMAGLAIVLSAAVELYALRGDIGRFNTVFKFYLQIWVLLALVAAIGTAVLVLRYRHLLAPLNRVAWATVALVLLLAGLTYPALATPARLDDRFNDLPRTLDGMAYMEHAVYDDSLPGSDVIESYPLKDDLDGINWLLDNVQGSPVILEGVTPLYRWGSRVSVYTGLPTVLGWDWHQTQQRAGYGDLINERRDDVEYMLGAEVDFEAIRPLLDKYHVRYIYVGALERVYYTDGALAKFDQAVQAGTLTVVYQNASVKIYAYTPASP